MADAVEKYRIPLFDGTNFSNWKFRLETLLTELELAELVEKPYTEQVTFLPADTAAEDSQGNATRGVGKEGQKMSLANNPTDC